LVGRFTGTVLPNQCGGSGWLHREKAEDGVRRQFLDPDVLDEAKRRARALIRARAVKPAQSL